MSAVQIQKSEGSQTTKLTAPRDLSLGEVFTHYGVPVISATNAKKSFQAVFFKRATLEIPVRLFGMPAAPAKGELVGVFEDVPGADADEWQQLSGWAVAGESGIAIGIVERIVPGTRAFMDRFILSMADGGGTGAATDYGARFESIETKNEDQDVEIGQIQTDANNLKTRVTTLEELISGGGDGPDLGAIQDQVDDIQTEVDQLASRATAAEAAIAATAARGQALMFKVVNDTDGTGVVTIAPGATKRLFLTLDHLAGFPFDNDKTNATPGGTAPAAAYGANRLVVNGTNMSDGVYVNMDGPYEFTMHLAPQPDQSGTNAGLAYYAGSAMAVTLHKFGAGAADFNQPVDPFPGKLDQAAGYWNSQRISASIPMARGEKIAIDITNTNSGAAGDDQPLVLGPLAFVLVTYRGKY